MALLELRDIAKSFAGIQVLYGIDMDIRAGEVHALIGENGAGKSTLVKLLSGLYKPDYGAMILNGKSLSFESPQEANRAGIHALYQEFTLLPHLSVAENIFLGSEPRRRFTPFIDWPEMRQQARVLLDQLGLTISPDKPVNELTVSEQQMVELAKTLHTKPYVLLMDEPTSTFSQVEVKLLFDVIRRIKSNGAAILYVSHRIDETLNIADRVTVLRDGRRILTAETADCTTDQLIRLMLGRAVDTQIKRHFQPGVEVLSVHKLSRRNTFEDISFQLHAGEIVGVAGSVGSGRTSLARVLFGIDSPDSGTIEVFGEPVTLHSPRDAVALGIALLPEDRQEQGLLLDMSARENISLTQLQQSGQWIDSQRESELVDQYIHRLRIKVPDPEIKARYLSGGTQQKIILSRWLATRPRILICDEPTRGIDVGTKLEIYRLFNDLARQGTAILMISSDFSEIVQLCDRALVMRSGRLITTLTQTQITQPTLLNYATGL